MRAPDAILFVLLNFVRIFLSFLLRLSAVLQIILIRLKKQYWGFKEEWNYIECKLTVIGSAITVGVVLFYIFTGNMLPVEDINTHIFAGFISIVAIVPAISLAVIEISSSYSTKLARVYIRSPYFWFLSIISIVVILASGIGLLRPEIQILRTVTPILGFFGILYLLPYFQAMMRFLDPKRAISKLGQQINLESLLWIVKYETVGPVPPAEDPIFPLIAIGIKATRERDLETLQLLLKEITLRHEQTLLSLQRFRPKHESTFDEVSREVLSTGKMREINDHFLNHLRSLKQFAFEEKNELSVICIIEYFTKLAEQTMQFRFIESARRDSMPTSKWVYEIFDIGKETIVHSFWDGTASSLRALTHISKAAMKNEYESLQTHIASLISDLSKLAMKMPRVPLHFIPGVILNSSSDVVKHRMEFGIYDFFLEREIESFNDIAMNVVKNTNPFHSGMVVSRCYENALFIAIFDYFVKKNCNSNDVAKTIYDALPFKYYYYATLLSLIQDRNSRKLFFGYQQYDPKKAIEDIIENGLRKISVEGVKTENYYFENCARSTLLELSRVFYEFKDIHLINEVNKVMIAAFFSAMKLDDFQLKEIPDAIFASYYACVRLGLISVASDLINSLSELALFAVKKKARLSQNIAMLIDYAGAVAISMNLPTLATQVITAITEFDEYYSSNCQKVPEINHIQLLVRNYPSPFRFLSIDEPYLSDGARGWLYRLFKRDIPLSERLVSDDAVNQFYTLYLFQQLPYH